MIPSECGGCVPVAARSASASVDQTMRPPSRALQPAEDQAEQAQLGVRLGAVEPPRDVRQRRAGLDERGRDGQRPRRRVRVGEGRGVHDDAGHQRGGQRAAVDVERDAEAQGEQRDHLAGRGGVRIDPVGVAVDLRSRRGGR